jgi:hypothetical protein
MRKYEVTLLFVVMVSLLGGAAPATAQEVRVSLRPGQVFMELVGQVLNPTATTSLQFGYLTYLRGVDGIFTTSTPSEQTAIFTFFNDTTTRSVVNVGPMRTVVRDGTMTIYAKTTPSDFANPDSFRSGMVVQVSRLRHTVIINTTTNAFVTVFENEITDVAPFLLRGEPVRIGQPQETFRLTVLGQIPSPAPPSGWISGFAEGTRER